MISIRFLNADGSVQVVQTEPGQSLMKAAVDANITGIEADCGGSLTCATCHVPRDDRRAVVRDAERPGAR